MFNNYLKIAIRNLLKNRTYSLINIFGFAIGITCTILILLWVQDEWSFDRFNRNSDNIYRVISETTYQDQVRQSAKTPLALGPALKDDFPEIVAYSRFGRFTGAVLIKYEENAFYEKGGAYVDPEFFEIFTTHFTRGDARTVFPDRFSVVLTESMAHKYFGEEDPIDKIIYLENFCKLRVTGIIKDFPPNFHLQSNFFVPTDLKKQWGVRFDNWHRNTTYTYLLLRNNTAVQKVAAKLSGYLRKHKPDIESKLYFQPLHDIYLKSNFRDDDFAELGDINTVYMFTLIAFLILLIACFNFINMSTAHYTRRTVEVSMRKVVGANRIQLIKQFLGESVLLCFIASILSLLLFELVLPDFNALTGKQISVNYWDFTFISGFLGTVIIIGIIAGNYPALFLSSFKPAKILRGSSRISSGNPILRNMLVIIQFIFSVGLIVSTIVVFQQLHYIQNKKLGIDKDNLIYIQNRGSMFRNYQAFKNEILQHTGVLNVTAALKVTAIDQIPNNKISWEGKNVNDHRILYALPVDYDYFETFKIKFKQGRSFSKKFSTDPREAVIINEEAVKLMGMDSPVGKQVIDYGQRKTIVGVVENYHISSLHESIKPLMVLVDPHGFRYIYIRLHPDNFSETLDFVEKAWTRLCPGLPFEFHFFDQTIERLYTNEQRLSKIFFYFTTLAIIVSCLGLFSLISFITEQRTKEIGVRKILGASVSGITLLLTRDVIKWMMLANLIAWPVAWYAMNQWLQNFAYRIDLSVMPFMFAGLGVLLITLLTVSWKTIRAAMANPVESLRYE